MMDVSPDEGEVDSTNEKKNKIMFGRRGGPARGNGRLHCSASGGRMRGASGKSKARQNREEALT